MGAKEGAGAGGTPEFRGTLCLVLAALLWKAAYLGGVVVALHKAGNLESNGFRFVEMQWPREGGPVFASHFATWDGAHYLYLSEVGYGPEIVSNAFYPLYPMVIRWISPLTNGSHLLAGLILSNVCSWLGWILFYRTARRRVDHQTALLATALLVAFPGSLFYQFVYTESLYFLLVMLVWAGLEERRFWWVWIGGVLLPLCRAVGVFVLLPIAWHLGIHRRLPSLPYFNPVEKRVEQPLTSGGAMPAKPSWAVLLAPFVGWLIYATLMRRWTGNSLAGFEAQQHWGVHSVWNLVDLPKFVVALFNPTSWHAFEGSVLDRCLFILLICLLPSICRLGNDMVVWTYVLGILSAMSGMFTSFTRYEATVFPMFLALASVILRVQCPWLLVATVGTSVVVHVWLLWRFLHFKWAG